MRLLIITQKVDLEDPVLGFFHEWIKRISGNFEALEVICLQKGKNNLPDNTSVYSLGKESKKSKLKYIWRFYRYVWQERKKYDAVFVHMNQEYVLLGFVFWKLWNKKIYLWRNHAKGGYLTKISCSLSHKVFYTSSDAYVAGFSNSLIMPVGIDVEKFKTSFRENNNKILIFGRVDPVKKVDQIIGGLCELEKMGTNFTADIVGNPSLGNESYYNKLKEKVKILGLNKKVKFLPAISPEESPSLYAQYNLFINLTPSGSLDKTIFEALSSGLKVVVANTFFRDVLPEEWFIENPNDSKNLARNIDLVLNGDYSENLEHNDSMSNFLKKHDLNYLIEKIVSEVNKD